MIGRRLASATGMLLLSTGTAMACSSMEEAMAHFEVVKDAYVAKAPTMSPEMFPVWTGHLETFGKKMGALDFPGACGALDQASLELGFGAAPASQDAAAPAAPAQPVQQEEVAQPAQPQPQPVQPVQQEQPQAPASDNQTASAGGGWQECPRGRCWARE